MRDDLPTGTVTFLFTDVEGSTKLLHELRAAKAAPDPIRLSCRGRATCCSSPQKQYLRCLVLAPARPVLSGLGEESVALEASRLAIQTVEDRSHRIGVEVV